MKLNFSIVLIFISFLTFSQKKPIVNDSIYNSSFVEKEPQYIGGIKEFYKYIGENYNLPNDKEFKGGKVFTSFVIEKDGSIADVKALRDVGFGTGEEAIRVLKKSPLWIPAEENGQKVRVRYILPLTLQLPSVESNDQKVYNLKDVDVKPIFFTGMDKFYEFIQDNYNKPIDRVKGKATISFIIEIDGTLTNFEKVIDIGFGTYEEIIRILKKSPKWRPAVLKDTLVRSKYLLLINVEDGSQVLEVREPPSRPFNPFGPTKDRNGY